MPWAPGRQTKVCANASLQRLYIYDMYMPVHMYTLVCLAYEPWTPKNDSIHANEDHFSLQLFRGLNIMFPSYLLLRSLGGSGVCRRRGRRLHVHVSSFTLRL